LVGFSTATVTKSAVARNTEQAGIMTTEIRRVLAGSLAAVALTASLLGQSSTEPQAQSSTEHQAPLTFDVVSVKPNTSGETGGTSRAQPGRYQGINVTLFRVITLAYRPVQEFAGGPDWIKTAHFDIEARSDRSPTPDQMLEMLRTMLADRFTLVVHNERKESPVYALTLARRDGRLGPRLKRAEAECAPPDSGPAQSSQARPRCGFRLGNGALSGEGATMARLASELSFVDRQVIDRTGLAGAFDIDLEWTPDSPGAAPSPDAGPSIFTAIQEQLGLRLEPATAPLDIIVIDSAERPTEN
jgi:uncharacterized protein (TIGR03435 family)